MTTTIKTRIKLSTRTLSIALVSFCLLFAFGNRQQASENFSNSVQPISFDADTATQLIHNKNVSLAPLDKSFKTKRIQQEFDQPYYSLSYRLQLFASNHLPSVIPTEFVGEQSAFFYHSRAPPLFI